MFFKKAKRIKQLEAELEELRNPKKIAGLFTGVNIKEYEYKYSVIGNVLPEMIKRKILSNFTEDILNETKLDYDDYGNVIMRFYFGQK